jgi:tetratricopeptide (TPR) repeat protein
MPAQWKRRLIVAAALALSPAGAAVADSLVVNSSGGGGGLTIGNVKILGVEGDTLAFQTAGGNKTNRPLAQVSKLSVDGEPALNDAETAFDAGDMEKAADAYTRAIRGASKDWIKDRSAQRLIEAANKTGRFDAAVTGYATLVTRNPALAAANRPAVADGLKPQQLDAAVKDVDAALATPRLSTEQQSALLGYQLELHRARKDGRAAGEVAERLLKLNADNPNDPLAARALADLKLNLARVALDEKNYDKALAEVEANKQFFNDPAQQAQALWVIAESKAAQAEAAGKSDKQTLQDLALNYMRVAANFRDAPAAPHVAEALVKAAALLEKMKEPKEAASLYEQVARAYAGQPAGLEAKAAADRLRTATK